ncbi:MAG TPA: hypothetical protein VM513_01700 [Kofleriaceae bacterium]|jgi:hypothetical protein|nr:hypothetical protein [Kofleriaceae bacterium]
MAHDDDILTGPVPAPDDEPTAAERAHAKTFADLVDKALVGRPPAAMSADDRALLEVATVIRASHGAVELSASKQRSIVEDALRQAVGEGAAAGGVTPISQARRARWAPWAIAGASMAIAAAAVALLALRVPKSASRAPEVGAVTKTPTTWTSRPADPLIGPIAREAADQASARIDYIFADRLDGYRERRLSRGGTR